MDLLVRDPRLEDELFHSAVRHLDPIDVVVATTQRREARIELGHSGRAGATVEVRDAETVPTGLEVA